MEKETDTTGDEDFNIDELLTEDEDSPTEEIIEKPKRKGAGRPKGTTKKEDTPEVPIEVANAEKDILDMEWQQVSQPAYEGYQNIKTGEVIDSKEAIRRCLCYAQEAAINSR